MKKLKKEEAAKVKLLYGNSHVYDAVRALKVGEAIILMKSEWDGKSTSQITSNLAQKGMKISIKTLADKDGWLITKVK